MALPTIITAVLLLARAAPLSLDGIWTHIPAASFDHSTLPSWTNQACVYAWKNETPSFPFPFETLAAAAAAVGDDAETSSLTFSSPRSCLDDKWKGIPATINVVSHGGGGGRGGGGVVLKFRFIIWNHTTGKETIITQTGTPNDAGTTVDMSDGGLYVRTSKHPFFLPGQSLPQLTRRWLWPSCGCGVKGHLYAAHPYLLHHIFPF